MARVVHIVGNGDHCHLYRVRERKGLKLTCNVAPFYVEGVYSTMIVDFKMMKAITDGSVTLPGNWIVGMRPKIWLEKNPGFYMKVANGEFLSRNGAQVIAKFLQGTGGVELYNNNEK